MRTSFAALLHVALDLDVALAELVDEALQRGCCVAVVGERSIEELIDRLRRLWPEPCQHRAAQSLPVGAEQFGEEFVRRKRFGAVEPAQKQCDGFGYARIVFRLSPQRRPQRAGPRMREREQIVVVEAEQRAFEQDGKRQVVVGHQQEIDERDEVLHRELIGELHAVGAGDGHAEPLQLADHRRCEGIAAPHQDQNVAGAHGAAFGGKLLIVGQPPFDRGGDPLAQRLDRARSRRLLAPGLERRGFGRLLLGFDLPQLYQPRLTSPEGVVLDARAFLPCQSVRCRVASEHAIDGLQDRLGRAEGKRERNLVPRETERRCLTLEGAAHLAEPRRVGALEREDRLLLVADGEQRAELLACPGAGEELGGKRLDDAPLRRVGVLRLVNQDVVDAAVDFVQHPGGGVGARQQRLGP